MSIETRDVSFGYPGQRRALHLPDLDVPRGSSLAVIGPSGSGKTTFLNLLSALLLPTSGTIRVSGRALNALSERQAQQYRSDVVGYVFQDFGLLDHLNAWDNILHPFRICRGRRLDADARQKAESAARALGLTDHLLRRPEALSQGEKQRVAICRAVVTEPEVILADEPTGNLDPDTARRILDQLLEVQARLSSTLVLVTHDHSLAGRLDAVVDFRDCWGGVT